MLTFPIALAIGLLLAIVATSYRQTIKAYPQGGGSYIVTKDNLGTWPALVAGASLLIDYVLTVAVSISAGRGGDHLGAPAAPRLQRGAGRGIRGPDYAPQPARRAGIGRDFRRSDLPVYRDGLRDDRLGMFRYLTDGPADMAAAARDLPVLEPLAVFLVLRAFASGNAALTGVEAISDGVPAFKEPEWRNARITLLWMAVILGVLFLGITASWRFSSPSCPAPPKPLSPSSGASRSGRIRPRTTPTAATMLILVLAANTAFSDFPRLGYFLARDHFIPHQFQFRGTGRVQLGHHRPGGCSR